ncbi:hypothetical protein M433DRAFT_155112 [Acidomyces richmondensis BFW]|nr:MAG: hypothetical protein FE78DRAFT_91742 [Acidomyces sp. 'richmondensis']KYG44890.1 hypothetical protein M433DRAFT_155112 [Acidomyces richmondensis BFW]
MYQIVDGLESFHVIYGLFRAAVIVLASSSISKQLTAAIVSLFYSAKGWVTGTVADDLLHGAGVR